MELGFLGEGFPILFELIKYIIILLTVLTIFFFVPSSGIIGGALSKCGDKVDDDEPLSAFSFGAFLKCTETEERFVYYEERESYIFAYCLILFFATMIAFGSNILIRWKLL